MEIPSAWKTSNIVPIPKGVLQPPSTDLHLCCQLCVKCWKELAITIELPKIWHFHGILLQTNGDFPSEVNNSALITQCGSTVYIGIAQVTRYQPCTFVNSSFHFHYAFHFTFEEISVKSRKGNSNQKMVKICCIWYEILAKM